MTATAALLGVCGLAALATLWAWFRALLRAGRSASVAVVLLTCLLVESVLYSPIDLPRGLFHLALGGFQVRTLDLVLLAAVLARLSLRRREGGGLTAAAWLVFGAWLLFEAYLGVRAGNPTTDVEYELKAVLYLGVGYAVAGGRLSERDLRMLTRFCTASAVVAGALLATSLARLYLPLGGGLLRGASLGLVSASSATVFPMVGVLALALFLCTEPARYRLLAAALVLFGTVLAPGQRASLVELGVSLATLLALAPLGRRHLRVSLTQIALGLAAVVLVAGSGWLVQASTARQPSVPFAREVGLALHSHQKTLSAQDRVNQLHAAGELIAQQPVLGYGLGRTIVYWEAGSKQFVVSYLSHNVVADLLLRTGAVGLAFFLLAWWLAVNDGVKRWRSPAATPVEAALALAAVAVLAGWLAHGMVESLFEQVRITPFAFLLYGLSRTARLAPARLEARSPAPAALATALDP